MLGLLGLVGLLRPVGPVGLLGRIAKLGEQYVTVEIAPNTEITVQRAAIAQLLPKGTIKAL